MSMVETRTSTSPTEGDLVREANHRIANHLALIASMIQLQISALGRGPETLSRAQVQEMLHETIGKIVGIGHLHRALAHRPHCGDVDLGDYLIESCAALVSSLALGDRVSVAQRLAANCPIAPEQAQMIGLIVGEVVMNAVKHAHPTGLPVQIVIGCSRAADGGITLDISDDGVGLPEGFDMARNAGVGFKLVRSLADKLGATLDVESDSLGLSYWLKLPPPSSKIVQLHAVAAR
jgi:two-component sensor histidine kinase